MNIINTATFLKKSSVITNKQTEQGLDCTFLLASVVT